MNLFAKNLRYLRKRSNLSQERLGKKLFASQSLIGGIEIGNKVPNLDFVIRACTHFDTDISVMTKTDLSRMLL